MSKQSNSILVRQFDNRHRRAIVVFSTSAGNAISYLSSFCSLSQCVNAPSPVTCNHCPFAF